MDTYKILEMFGLKDCNLSEKLSKVNMKDYIKDCESITGMFDKLNDAEKNKVVESLNKLNGAFDDMFGIKTEKWTIDDLKGKNIDCKTTNIPGCGDTTVVTIKDELEKNQHDAQKQKVEEPFKKEKNEKNQLKEKIVNEIKEEKQKTQCSLKDKLIKEMKSQVLQEETKNSANLIVAHINSKLVNKEYKMHMPKENVSGAVEVFVSDEILSKLNLKNTDISESMSFQIRDGIAKILDVDMSDVILNTHENVSVYIILKY